MALTTDQFAKAVINAGLSSTDEIKSLWAALPTENRPKDGESLAQLLVARKKLTPFQAAELLAGGTTPLVLGDYVLLAKIGAGGMGQVFKAQHRHMKRLVAIKLLSTALTNDPGAVQRFQREVEAAAKLSHPNIVHANDASVQRGVWYLVMEYVEGRDLSSIAAAGPLSVGLAVEYVRQAARGLAYAHEKGVVHRDIKPANLLLDEKGTIKILDMGLARLEDGAAAAQDGLTKTGQVMGTIDYMAPEQAFDTHTADARADIYSLGCTLYRLLTGANLFEGNTLVQKLMAHQHQSVPDLTQRRADAPRELDLLFRKMVAKKPEDRFQTMAEVEAALAAFLSERSASFADPTPESSSKLSVLFPSRSGQDQRPPITAVAVPTLARPTAETNPASGDAATMALTSPSQGTAPVSGHSVQIAKRQSRLSASLKRPPFWRQPWVKVAGGLGGALLVLLGIWVIIRDKEGNEVARFKVPDGGKAELVEGNGPAQPPAPSNVPSNVKSTNTSNAPSNSTNTAWHDWPANAPQPARAPFNAAQARKHQEEWAAYLKAPVEYTNSIGMKFILIPPGEFLMGSTPAEIEAALKLLHPNDALWRSHVQLEGPQHKVILTRPTYLGIHEVTQAQYEQVMGTNPSDFAATGMQKAAVAGMVTTQHPVEMVSWLNVLDFCAKLSEREKLKPSAVHTDDTITPLEGNGYQIPTEAEWEFACRAGTTTKYWSGDKDEDLVRAGWSQENSGGRTHAVGELKANPFGLFDVHGNVMELVRDTLEQISYNEFRDGPAINPTPLPIAGQRLCRGGKYGDQLSRGSASRFTIEYASGYRHPSFGFRVSLPVDSVKLSLNK